VRESRVLRPGTGRGPQTVPIGNPPVNRWAIIFRPYGL